MAARRKKTAKKTTKKKAAGKTAPMRVEAKNRVSKKAQDEAAAAGKRSFPRRSRETPVCIVGIGISGGGFEAMSEFLSGLTEETGIGFVLIPHLDPSRTSMMSDLLQKYTRLEVSEAVDGATVKADHMYIIPPGKDMAILNGSLHLLDPQATDGVRHPIDYFFRTLAKDQGERAVCIVLSGAGTDGTQGLKDIKGVGGMVMVQDPVTARYDGMPGSAIDTGLVDFVLPPQQMPDQLLRYVRHPYIEGVDRRDALMRSISESLDKVVLLIRDQTGHDFSYYKPNTIIRRVERRMNLHQITDVAAYIKYLRENHAEVKSLSKELFIGVTSFFRDPEAFEALNSYVLPQIFKKKSNDNPVRVWVPGCSTGEEAFSLAMVLSEYRERAKKKCSIQIFATDTDTEAIDRARTGVYSENISADVSIVRLKKYFNGGEGHYHVKKSLREMVVFAVQDVTKDPPFTKLDIVSCRNLLIYLEPKMQKKLLPLFHFALNPEGVLFLGSSESVGDSTDLFSPLDKKWKIFRRRNSHVAVHGRLDFPVTYHTEWRHADAFRKNNRHDRKKMDKLELGEVARRLLVGEYSHITRLEHLLEQLRDLHSVIARDSHLKLKRGKGAGRVASKVQADEMQKELNATKRYLQHIIEDKEATNEELQASNEELQSANEELQTSKEEIQSVNEELVTVNSELHNNIDEFASANNDLKYLLASTDTAVIFLNNDLRVKRFTPAAQHLVKFIDADIGRPIDQLNTAIEGDDFMADVKKVLRNLVPLEREVRTKDGEWFSMRVMPYRTPENVIAGVILTFFDITDIKNSQYFSDALLSMVGEPILVLDKNLNVISANSAYYKRFKTKKGDTLGKRIYDLGNGQWKIPKLNRLLENILQTNSELKDFIVEHSFPKIGFRRMLLNARRIYEESKSTDRILLAIVDVTGKVHSNEGSLKEHGKKAKSK